MDVIVQVESGIHFIDVAFNNNIDKLLVSWWIQNKKEIIDAVLNQHRKLFQEKQKV